MKTIINYLKEGQKKRMQTSKKDNQFERIYLFKNKLIPLFLISALITACGAGKGKFDATGTFEAEEIIVSSEAAGKLVAFDVEEGFGIKQNKIVGVVDTTQLYLKKKQLEYSIKALLSKLPDVSTQIAAIQEQIETALTEKKRIENLVKSNAATTKQLDDINSQIEILNKQLNASKSSLNITREGLRSETYPLQIQIEQIQDQINKSIIKNPVDGTVLSRYTKQNEVTANGKALYKIADLSIMTLRAYINGDQLGQVKLGQKVKVFVDKGEGEQKELNGEIYWISSKAEFTPKTIQTKDERANLVYAVKVKVKNDGYLKIGMYGEIKF